MGKTHNMTNTKNHMIWRQMKTRCNSETHRDYMHYGGRGIKVCESWQKDYMAFYNWSIANGYQEGLSIERENNNGNYEPSNCKWIPRSEQWKNRRPDKMRNTNTTGYIGIERSRNKWRARIAINKQTIEIGRYASKIEAAKARDKYIIDNKLNRTLNFPK